MDSINVFVYYNGECDQSRSYNNYSIVGIVVPLDCSYVNLVGIIMKELKLDDSDSRLTIQYQVIATGPLIQIDTDSSLYFYIQVKQGGTDLTKFPLCVDIEKVNRNENSLGYLCNTIAEGDSEEFHERSITNHTRFGSMEKFLITNFPTIQEMGNDICENVTNGYNNIDDMGFD
ncbi:uncharacterized protein Fot_26826 [Forsythia ovata]|uniref:Uncharacterized protein n=1 Tax=Forsythia ovata TaxID=205694 RepID=A0ABD1UEH2_9LAMI